MTKKELFKKLDELGVKEQFISNLVTSHNGDKHEVATYYKNLLKADFEDCILSAFDWQTSPQGLMFWSNISTSR